MRYGRPRLVSAGVRASDPDGFVAVMASSRSRRLLTAAGRFGRPEYHTMRLCAVNVAVAALWRRDKAARSGVPKARNSASTSLPPEIGRESGWERVCRYVKI